MLEDLEFEVGEEEEWWAGSYIKAIVHLVQFHTVHPNVKSPSLKIGSNFDVEINSNI